MNIGLDIDGVIYPWHYSIYRFFTEFKNYTGSEREFWSYFDSLDGEVQDYYVSIPIHYLDQTPSEDVMKYLPKLAELGEIFYITSRKPELMSVTRKFFNIYDLPFKENVIFSKNKANYIRLHHIDYFVDDSPKVIDEISGITTAYLFKCAHNWKNRDNYSVIGSLGEFYQLLGGKNDTSIEVDT